MMQATVIKTFESDYIINIDENESDIPEAPFSCWVVPMEEMNVYSLRVISAEQRAAQLQADRDENAYQARMEAARIAYDAAQQFKTDNCFDHMHAAMIIFRQIAGEYAEKKS